MTNLIPCERLSKTFYYYGEGSKTITFEPDMDFLDGTGKITICGVKLAGLFPVKFYYEQVTQMFKESERTFSCTVNSITHEIEMGRGLNFHDFRFFTENRNKHTFGVLAKRGEVVYLTEEETYHLFETEEEADVFIEETYEVDIVNAGYTDTTLEEWKDFNVMRISL